MFHPAFIVEDLFEIKKVDWSQAGGGALSMADIMKRMWDQAQMHLQVLFPAIYIVEENRVKSHSSAVFPALL